MSGCEGQATIGVPLGNASTQAPIRRVGDQRGGVGLQREGFEAARRHGLCDSSSGNSSSDGPVRYNSLAAIKGGFGLSTLLVEKSQRHGRFSHGTSSGGADHEPAIAESRRHRNQRVPGQRLFRQQGYEFVTSCAAAGLPHVECVALRNCRDRCRRILQYAKPTSGPTTVCH
jgi:hypothetical protein